MSEVWKSIPGYEDCYEASSHGRIRSITRIVDNGEDKRKKILGRIIKLQHASNGYIQVSLSKNGKVKIFRVHRLVALTFIENSNNFSDVNHINEDKTDNRVENLEWVSHQQNTVHGTRNARTVAHRNQTGSRNGMFGRTGSKSPVARAVVQLDMKGNVVAVFGSVKEAASAIGRTAMSITNAIVGRTSHCNGFKWQYKSSFTN